MPPSRRPLTACLRERLRAGGPAGLSDLELLTLVLGRVDLRGAERARSLLDAEGLGALGLLSADQLTRQRRLGRAQAAILVASFELGRRVYRPESAPLALADAADAYAVTRDLELCRREVFMALLLDARNCVLSRETVSLGSLSASIVHPREVFRTAVERGAASVILVHNHPSGNAEPSPEDIALTRRLAEAGTLLGIEVLDHLVIGRGDYVSLKNRGIL